MNNTFIVYCHTAPNGKKYVGITSTDPQYRWRNGLGYDKNYHFFRAIEKYGWESFKHEILFENLPLETAKQIERDLIAEWHLTDRRFGYNLREGGDGSLSPESRSKMSISRIGNTNCVGNIPSQATKEKISASLQKYYAIHPNPFKGCHHSEATKQKLRDREVSPATKEKMRANHADVSGANNPSAKAVVQLSKDGQIIKYYPYAGLAATELSLDLSCIIKCCRGKHKTCGGFRWEYAGNK